MFKVLVSGGRKSRRTWSAGTVAASVAAHALFFAGFGYASIGTAAPRVVCPDSTIFGTAGPPAVCADSTIIWDSIAPLPPPPPPPAPAPAPQQPVELPKQPPRTGDFRTLIPPSEVPDQIAAPTVEPVTAPEQYNGIGVEGSVVGPPDPGNTAPLTSDPPVVPGAGEAELFEASTLAEAPTVQNRREVQRLLERSYPPTLREAGVSGRATLQFIVNTDGQVDPASIRLVDATHEQLGEASIRAVERFRFRPARVNGTPVRVLISLPIDWVAPK